MKRCNVSCFHGLSPRKTIIPAVLFLIIEREAVSLLYLKLSFKKEGRGQFSHNEQAL